MKEIKVLVSGCKCSQNFAALVEQLVVSNGIDATVEIVSDIMQVMQYGVMTLPALVVDGVVVGKGNLSEKEVLDLIK